MFIEGTKMQLALLTILAAFTHAQGSVANVSTEAFLALQRLVYNDNNLYAAGTNTLYKIDATSLSISSSASLIDTDLQSCRNIGCPTVVTTLAAHNATHLFYCTTRQGKCALVSGTSLAATVTSDPNIVTTDEIDGTVVSVAATFQYEDNNPVYSVWISSSFTAKEQPAMAIRNPDTFQPSYIAPPSLFSDNFFQTVLPYKKASSTIKYVYAFYLDGYRFIVMNRYGKAYVGGMCSDDARFNTLTHLPLKCNSEVGTGLTHVQTAFMARAGSSLHHVLLREENSDVASSDIYLYGVFTATATSTATSICAFGVKTLIQKLDDVFKECHTSGLSDVEVGPDELADAKVPTCTSYELNSSRPLCEIVQSDSWNRKKGYSPLIYHIDEARGSIIDLQYKVSAFHVQVIDKYTVGFMISPGHIRKVLLGAANTMRGEYKSDNLTGLMSPGTSLLPTIAVGGNRVYAATRKEVLSVPISQCHIAATCQMCSDLKDPYCGWCSLSSSCTTIEQCPNSDSQGHWLQPDADGNSGCIQASLEESFSISLDDGSELAKLKVLLNEVPLKAENEQYRCCYFGETSELCFDGTKKVKNGLLGTKTVDYLECPTPSKSEIFSRIEDEKDNIVTNITLKVELDQFARIELTFYSCSIHQSCMTCADTNFEFSCNWCLETYTCFNSLTSSSCGADSYISNIIEQTSRFSGSSECPQISVDSSPVILVPSSTRPYNIIVNLSNRRDFMANFKCVMSWDDQLKVYPTRIAGDAPSQTLQCLIPDNVTYVGAEPTKDVTLRVEVEEGVYIDNPMNVRVELYKCNNMKQTCSECLGVGVHPKYQCGWCQSTSRACQVRQLCDVSDSRHFLETDGICPEVEISQIIPINGPIQGGTSLTISGVNLGKSYAEIRNGVKILVEPNVNCVINETQEHNPLRVVCVTSEATVGSGEVRLTVVGESMLNARSTTAFSFYDIKVDGLSTDKGPVSGGTKVAIVGKYINIGSNKQISMLLENRTEIKCEIIVGEDLDQLVFYTPAMTRSQLVTIKLTVDGAHFPNGPRNTDFTFYADSTVENIIPNKGILSGGTTVTVTGTNLDLIQSPIMYLELLGPSPRRRRLARSTLQTRFEFLCGNVTSSQMTCPLPTLPEHWTSTGNISYGFILDNIQTTQRLNERSDFPPFIIVPDPVFYEIGDQQIIPNSIFEISGKNLLAIGGDDIVLPLVNVDLTLEDDGNNAIALPCNISAIKDTAVFCDLPKMESSKKYLVTVKYGSVISVELGTVMASPRGLTTMHYIIIGAGGGVVLIIVAVVIIVLKRKVSQTDEGMKKLQDKMNHLEMTVAKECKEAFTELQTDMTEMTADIAALHGLPFYEYKQYCMKVLFPVSLESDHPVTRPLNIQGGRDSVEQGLRRFQELMYNKTFLLTFIRTLEQQKKFTVRERVELASYVSVALQPKMEYHTDILKTLLADLIERTMDSKKDPKILLRRNESVAEKMLSNWFAFLLQKFLKECAGEPLYLLYRAIKQHIDKGPVDAVTADAKYSLSEDKLLRQSVESQLLSLRFCSPDQHAAQDPQTVKVLDCDTISQAIDKILDTLYRNVPNSTKPLKDNLVLEWVKENGERVPMSDDDSQFSKVESDGSKRLVTLQCYKITDNAMVALAPRQNPLSKLTNYDTSSSTGNYYGSTGDSMSRANSLNNILDMAGGARERQQVVHKYHLVKSSEVDTHQEGEKMISEIYLNRLLFTKGTLQQFVDDLFETIFSTSHRGSALPLAIKYMFDFLDDQALLHNISNPEVIHHWKSNSLPLRFWVNVIKNPDFVFDIHKSNTVDACLTVVAQIFMDSCSLTEHRLGKDSPSSKLLYAKDIPKYRTWVDRYYSDIKSMPAISDQDMNGILLEESRQHRSEFNANAALYELYQYVITYRGELMTALREDEFAKKDRLADQLDYVNQLLNTS